MLVDAIAIELGLSREYLLNIGTTASHRYKSFTIPKRTGGSRTIQHPGRELKAIQRWLNLNIIRRCFAVHHCSAAYEPGSAIEENARKHVASNYLLRMDFTKFFPSFTKDDICTYLGQQGAVLPEEWSDADDGYFVSIVCRHGELTIGAVTSPSLTNAICYELDSVLAMEADKLEVTYTRYADDMFFSCRERGILKSVEHIVRETVEHLGCPANLKINKDKTWHTSRKGHRSVTGLVLTSDKHISIGRKRKREIRALVHQWDDLDDAAKASLRGTLAFVKGVEPDLINRLILKYGHERIRTIAG